MVVFQFVFQYHGSDGCGGDSGEALEFWCLCVCLFLCLLVCLHAACYFVYCIILQNTQSVKNERFYNID